MPTPFRQSLENAIVCLCLSFCTVFLLAAINFRNSYRNLSIGCGGVFPFVTNEFEVEQIHFEHKSIKADFLVSSKQNESHNKGNFNMLFPISFNFEVTMRWNTFFGDRIRCIKASIATVVLLNHGLESRKTLLFRSSTFVN